MVTNPLAAHSLDHYDRKEMLRMGSTSLAQQPCGQQFARLDPTGNAFIRKKTLDLRVGAGSPLDFN